MTIYHIDKTYTGYNDQIRYDVAPYDLKGTIKVYLKKWHINKDGKETRDIVGLFKFFKLSSFNAKKLENKAKKMNGE